MGVSGYSYHDLVEGFSRAGLRRGDVVHLHSAIFSLGLMEGVEVREISSAIYKAILDIIGEEGTLTVPAAFEDYARFGQPYDCKRSPVDRAQGVFSQFIAGLPQAVRTFCPLCAVAAIGPLADEICHQPTGSAFGTGSAWEKLMELDAKMCFLGVAPARAFTFTGYIQARFGVPHFYNKIYTVPVYEDGQRVDLSITAAVRYLNPKYKIVEECGPFEESMRRQGMINSQSIGRGVLCTISSVKRLFLEGTKLLQRNVYYFCKIPPCFSPGEIPMDGPTGPYQSNYDRFGVDFKPV